MKQKNFEIDWEAQWATHAPHYSNGSVNLDLSQWNGPYSKVQLKPGPGFGDLSHPTTRLVLNMMGSVVKGKYVCDIGCGSGVLTVCAVGMGACFADGIDIDVPSLEHSRINAQRNGMDSKTRFLLPEQYKGPQKGKEVVVLMNMIRSEQVVAWNSVPSLHSVPATMITSGILEKEKDVYLEQCHKWGWNVLEIQQEGEWIGIKAKMQK